MESNINLNELVDMARRATQSEVQTIKRDRDGDVPVLIIDKAKTTVAADQILSAFERTQGSPYRRRGTYLAADVPSFLDWMAHNAPEESPVFGAGLEALGGEWRKPKLALIGIANYSDKKNGAWHDLRARYEFTVSDSWTVWAAHHSEPDKPDWFDQGEFAEFVEERIYDITTPLRNERLSEAVTRFLEANKGADHASPSDLFKLSRDLKVRVDQRVEAKLNTQSGEAELQYTEEHTAAGGRPLKVPALFYVRIPVFFGQEPVLIGVKLRYRVAGGKVVWAYSLFAPDMIVADEFKKACDVVRKAPWQVYLGTPDSP